MLNLVSSPRLAQTLELDTSYSSEVKAKEDNKAAKAMWRLTTASAGASALTSLSHTDLPPLAFLGLTRPNEEDGKICRATCQNWWDVLQRSQASARQDNNV